jgi:hypothetical protein
VLLLDLLLSFLHFSNFSSQVDIRDRDFGILERREDAGEGDFGEGDLGEGDLGEGDLGEGDLGEGDLGILERRGDTGEGDFGILERRGDAGVLVFFGEAASLFFKYSKRCVASGFFRDISFNSSIETGLEFFCDIRILFCERCKNF